MVSVKWIGLGEAGKSPYCIYCGCLLDKDQVICTGCETEIEWDKENENYKKFFKCGGSLWAGKRS